MKIELLNFKVFKQSFTGLFIVIVALLTIGSCRDRSFIDSSEVMLRFSEDTLRFDTVFTELGSATRFIKVFNDFDQSVLISDIRLAQPNSFFNLNVDGFSNNEVQDIEILPNDSLWIFAETTIDPDAPLSVSPFIIEDQILFNTNGNDQKVHLEAWGQNANYIPNRYAAGTIDTLSTICGGDTLRWDDDKPYVVYGLYYIRDCNLLIESGTQVYVHGGIANNDFGIYNDGLLWVGPDASITIRGTVDEPVVMQGDRLEAGFQDVSGQWPGIRILAGSTGNNINHAIIKNASVGIEVDSAATLVMNNTEIANTSSSGLVAIHASVTATNCLFQSNGSNAMQVVYGGDYNMNYCTFANYGNQGAALGLINFICDDPACLTGISGINPLNAVFRNSIIAGSAKDEIVLADATQGEQSGFFDFDFNNCIVKVAELLDEGNFPNFFDRCIDCKNMELNDTLFVDISEDDYHLDTMSIAENKAIPLFGINTDIEGNPRDSNTPDLGCFEFQ